MLTFVKHEGNNLMSMVTTLHSIIEYKITCFCYITSKIYYYSTNDEKVITSVKYVNVKIAQGSLQKIITWTKKSKKGRMHVLAMSYGFENCKPWWRPDLLIKWLFWEGIGVQTSHYFELSMAFDNDL